MGLVETLRRETRPAHDAIEAAVDIERHLVSPDAYRALMTRYLGFHAAFEAARDGSAARAALDPALVPEVSRAGLIRQDLLALGMSPGEVDRLPRPRLSRLDSLPALLGAVYVIEGSSLGGVVLAKMVETRLGIGEGGAAFLAGDGRDTARRWRAAVAALDASVPPAAADEVVASARATYARMQDWLAPAAAAPLRAAAPAV